MKMKLEVVKLTLASVLQKDLRTLLSVRTSIFFVKVILLFIHIFISYLYKLIEVIAILRKSCTSDTHVPYNVFSIAFIVSTSPL